MSVGPLGAAPQNVVVLTDEAATRDAVLRAVTALGQRVKAAGGSGLITFSGHGAASPDAGRAGAKIGATIAVAPADVALNAAGEVEGLVTLGELQPTSPSWSTAATSASASGELAARVLLAGAHARRAAAGGRGTAPSSPRAWRPPTTRAGLPSRCR